MTSVSQGHVVREERANVGELMSTIADRWMLVLTTAFIQPHCQHWRTNAQVYSSETWEKCKRWERVHLQIEESIFKKIWRRWICINNSNNVSQCYKISWSHKVPINRKPIILSWNMDLSFEFSAFLQWSYHSHTACSHLIPHQGTPFYQPHTCIARSEWFMN